MQPRSIHGLPMLAVASLLTIMALAGLAGRANAEKPNIVIILVDDLGYGDPGCYNPKSKIATSNIDRLAADGLRFTDAHAAGPLCHLSRYGLLTGQYPFRVPIDWRREPVIPRDRMTIASLLRSQGYHTTMVGKWHLGFVEAENESYEGPLRGGPVDRGFDRFFGIRASTDIPPYFYIRDDHAVTPPTDRIADNNTAGWTNIQGKFWRAGGIAPDLRLDEVLPRFTDEAVNVIHDHALSSNGKQPLLLYLAYPAPHTPWLPSREFSGTSGADLYGDFTVMVDAMIGKVLKALDDNSLRDNTLVIFTSDNGPVWYDQDVARFGHDSSGGWRGMKADAWENGHRVPLIVRWPNRVAAGTKTDQTVCFTDLLATFAAITDAELPTGAGPDSFNLLPVFLGNQPEASPIRGPVAMAAGNGMMMVRVGDWKLIEGLGSGGFSEPKKIAPSENGPRGQLYNLATDPGERTNLYQERPEMVSRLKAALEQIQKSDQTRPSA